MKNRILLFTFYFLPVFFSGCMKEDHNVIKIALVSPFTGDLAVLGQGMKKAVEMAVEDANASGKFKGITLKLVTFDDRADPKEAVNVANRIISDKKIFGVVGHLNSGCSIPASQVYAKENLVMISPGSTNPKLTLQGLKNIFRVCTTDDIQGNFAANYVINNLKIKRVAVIHDKTAYGQGVAESFKNNFEEKGGKAVSFDGIDSGDKDFKALLTSIKTKKPSLIYFGGPYPECGLITKQAKELGLNIPIFSDDAINSPEYVKIGGKATEGDYATMIGIPAEKLPKAKKFVDKFKNTYPDTDMQPYDTNAYEAASIIINAIENTNIDKLKIVDYISKIKFNGILGKTSFDKNGDTLNKNISIYKIINGKFVYVGK
ncbi:MAG: hypothetical protein A2539_10610 [Elusimicrobia bacterium RIFOXYD2_FULL_34_15]|nr:MAG: hypothetical protein A2539_10610 [Elusimicrobia bacterium RIFOXYD2_FULL_34_15]